MQPFLAMITPLSGGGMRPDNTLPGGQPYPDQGLPGQPGIWPRPPQGGPPQWGGGWGAGAGGPRPDQGLPGQGGPNYPSQGLPIGPNQDLPKPPDEEPAIEGGVWVLVSVPGYGVGYIEVHPGVKPDQELPGSGAQPKK